MVARAACASACPSAPVAAWSARPSAAHTAPPAAQSDAAASVTVTSFHESGLTRTRQRSPPTRSTPFTLPPSTGNDAAVGARPPSPSAALKRTSTRNDSFPSCSAGTRSNDAVSGGAASSSATATVAVPPVAATA